MITCPKCGFEQEDGKECRRCGIIFDRYLSKHPAAAPPSPNTSVEESTAGSRSLFKVIYRIVTWATLVVGVITLVLVLRQAPPPKVATDPRAAVRVQAKMNDLQRDLQAGHAHSLQLEEAEVNSWIDSNLALARESPPQPATAAAAPKTTPADQSASSEPTVQEVQSSMKDVKLNLKDDLVSAYVLFNFRGKDLSLSLDGRLRAENGYLRFEPVSGKFGSLPLPQSALSQAVERLFTSPENREKFKLPPEISDIHVENGKLVVSYRESSR